ncbi:T6SS phospholipase effector Tle1-like catalytic domain-containing protein [Massilia horti]|uniref:DUF2235 domain-containing protein n=1 Tax=Massilia horti TaxID=2562153 RepID=A0A4Y9T546_9BURK|nr:DUF2235 domain-containing protein [Massilia horti]TFW32108.1 DUF2235 domain-containing protein [Massilia horti]
MNGLSFKILPSASALTAGINMVLPNHHINFQKCETNLNVGIFFDGTGNNREHDRNTHRDSNISRLFDAYENHIEQGYYGHYIPGVGTPFPEIGEKGENWLDQGFGIGCESRVIFALLMMLEYLHRRSFDNRYLFKDDEIIALCRDTDQRTMVGYRILARIDTKYHGVIPPMRRENELRGFLRQLAIALEDKLRAGKPRIVECFLDVFGFSRGAAQARVFCRWLSDMLVDGKLAGIPLRFRFVGLMDTVASAGVLTNAKALATIDTGGHSGWALAEFLRLPSAVENCVHMVAMHELRRTFPLDEIGHNGILPPGCHQYAYPGSHSDVGGGYAPGELGASVGKTPQESDSLKLSQIPLNHMLDCAIATGVPIERPMVRAGAHDAFAIHPRLAQAYQDFLSAVTLTPTSASEHMQHYLNWRWQMRAHFPYSNQIKRASEADREKLLRFNRSLLADAAFLLSATQKASGMARVKQLLREIVKPVGRDQMKEHFFDPEARDVLTKAQRSEPSHPAFAVLFEDFVHDSLAGFDHPVFEYTGYWRYRKAYCGEDHILHTSTDDAEMVQAIVPVAGKRKRPTTPAKKHGVIRRGTPIRHGW